MTFSVVQLASNGNLAGTTGLGSLSTSNTVTFSSPTTSGNFLIAYLYGHDGGSGTTTIDSWTLPSGLSGIGSLSPPPYLPPFSYAMAYRVNCPGGITSLTFNLNGTVHSGSGFQAIFAVVKVYEISGVPTNSGLDEYAYAQTVSGVNPVNVTLPRAIENVSELLVGGQTASFNFSNPQSSTGPWGIYEDKDNAFFNFCMESCGEELIGISTPSTSFSTNAVGPDLVCGIASFGILTTPTMITAPTVSTVITEDQLIHVGLNTSETPDSSMKLIRLKDVRVGLFNAPSTSMAIDVIHRAALKTTIVPKIRFEAGGYSPRTIPMEAVFFPKNVRYIPMGVFLQQDQPRRVIPQSAIIGNANIQKVIPQTVCFGFKTIPQHAALRQPNIKRTISQTAVIAVVTRRIGQHAVFIPTTSGKRTIPQVAFIARLTRIIPQHAGFIAGSHGTRTITEHATFQLTQSNVKRIVPERAVFQLTQSNVRRTIPEHATFNAGFKRIIPQTASLHTHIVIPMVVQSPLIRFKIIRMSVATQHIYHRTIHEYVELGIPNVERTIIQHAIFGITAKRTIPQHANLNFVITYEIVIPETAALELTSTIVIPERVLLGGTTLSWIICDPMVGINVCSEVATV